MQVSETIVAMDILENLSVYLRINLHLKILAFEGGVCLAL